MHADTVITIPATFASEAALAKKEIISKIESLGIYLGVGLVLTNVAIFTVLMILWNS